MNPAISACLLVCLLIALATSVAPAAAAPATQALLRPAVMARSPERAVLLGAARAGARTVAVGERGIVVVSDDGGRSWRQVPCPVSVTLTAVRFADARNGIAVGHGGTVLATADGGNTWQQRLDGRRLAQIAADAARASGDAQQIKAAELLQQDGPDKPLLDAVLWDAQRIVVVGAYGIALASSDGGATWATWMARLDNPRGLHLYAVRRLGDALLIAGEQGLVLHSSDGGASFKRATLPYQGSFFTAELLAADTWLVAGLRGNAWRTSDGGATWVQLATPMPAAVVASALDANGTLWVANQAGFVLRLRGDAFVPVNRTPLAPLAGVLPGAAGGAAAVTIGFGGAAALPDDGVANAGNTGNAGNAGGARGTSTKPR